MPEFNIAEVSVTHTCYYTPETYLEMCKELGTEPSEDEYLNFLQEEIDDDFPKFDNHTVQITYNSAKQ